jgi:hypothetical protein
MHPRKVKHWHRKLLNEEMPLSIGGGIGRSRLCMYFLRKAHIGGIQASLWPDEMRAACRRQNIPLRCAAVSTRFEGWSGLTRAANVMPLGIQRVGVRTPRGA